MGSQPIRPLCEFFLVPISPFADPKFFRGLAIFFNVFGLRFEIIPSARIPVRTGLAFAYGPIGMVRMEIFFAKAQLFCRLLRTNI